MSHSAENLMFDVAVVGAGPAGLFAALAIARTGVHVALVANPARPGHDHRTTALLCGSVVALERLDVWRHCATKAQPLRTMRIIDDTGRLFKAPLLECRSDEIGLDAFGYNLANDDLVDALELALAQSSVKRFSASISRIEDNPDHSVLHADAGLMLSARLIVAADGRLSTLRQAAGIAVRETRYPQVAITMNVQHSRPHNDVSTEFHTPTGPFTLVPLPGGRSSVVCVVSEAEADHITQLDPTALSQELERRSHSVLGKLTVEAGFGRFPLGLLSATRYARNRVALVGEAAHVIPPIGAQGLNLGLRDGASLADCISQARSEHNDIGSESTLEKYHLSRLADIASRETAINLLNRSLLSDFLPITALRGGGLWAMDKVGPLRRLFMREGLQPSFAVPALMQDDGPRAKVD